MLSYFQQEECCVCYEGTRKRLPCRHVVCKHCQSQMNRCPMCRAVYDVTRFSGLPPSSYYYSFMSMDVCYVLYVLYIYRFSSEPEQFVYLFWIISHINLNVHVMFNSLWHQQQYLPFRLIMIIVCNLFLVGMNLLTEHCAPTKCVKTTWSMLVLYIGSAIIHLLY